ncbi:hypothetical protein [Tropicimonas sp. IMCC34043]|uniref:hypothetical protein n=1 Tax=Tropicimonas sp. IMCC34043 TaxID=2248760 RepID=UPI000E22C021|nr:hypothetical protein [Tropicimonas sp. IMCC34043]
MTPKFALTLSHEEIALLQRTPGGWQVLGRIGLDTQDLAAALEDLRALGLAHAGDAPLVTELVVPNSQILYSTLPAGGDGDIADGQLVADALDGATPYALVDLVYDWVRLDGQLHVAAVARETLDEAEDFASEHGFNPVAFVARPDPGDYPGEPWFGATLMAEELLDDDEAVEHEGTEPEPIVEGPEPEVAAPDTDAGPAEADVVLSGSGMQAPVAADSDARGDLPGHIAPGPGNVANAETDAGAAAESPAPLPPLPEPDPVPAAAVAPGLPAGDAPFLDGAPAEAPSRSTPPVPTPTFASIRRGSPLPSTAEASQDRPLSAAPPVTATGPVVRPGVPTLGPQSRTANEKVKGAAMVAQRPGSTMPVAETDPAAASVPVSSPPTPSASLARTTAGSAAAAAQTFAASQTVAAAPARPAVNTKVASKATGPAAPSAATLRAERRSEAEALTIFGARGAPRRPSLSRRIIPAAVAMIVLALGVWALRGLVFDGKSDLTTDSALTEPGGTSAAELSADPAFDPDADQTVTDLAEYGASSTTDEGIDPEALADLPLAAEDASAALLNPIEAQAAYATSGIWQRAPDQGYVPGDDQIDDVYIASIDPDVPEHDAFLLPDDLPAVDSRPRIPAAPPHPAQKPALGPDGRVVPTEAGSVTPDGIRIYSGAPVVVPPARPQSLQPEETPLVGKADDPLAGIRPKGRPGDLVETNEKAVLGGLTKVELAQLRPKVRPPSIQETAAALSKTQSDATEQAQRAADAASAAAIDRLATDDAVRQAAAPVPNPQKLAAASLAAAVAAQKEALAADLAGATRRAIPVSPVPQDRPSNMAQLADRAERLNERDERREAKAAEAAARAQADAEAKAAAELARQKKVAAAAAASTATAEELSDDEGESKGPAVSRAQRVSPAVPTSASVARRATLNNAIALNKVALIGVYGGSNDRRALVRLPSGKYIKVKIGDRIDGGRVAAIGDSELIYSKSGRNVTLNMPKG